MPSGAEIVALKYLHALRCKSDAERIEVARSLLKYINGELKESTPEVFADFHNVFDNQKAPNGGELNALASSIDLNDKKAAIFAILCLTEVEISGTDVRYNRFFTYLFTKALYTSDRNVGELAAKALAYVAGLSKVFATDLVDRALKQTNEWLEQEKDRNEVLRMSAVLVMRELARSSPTFFFNKAERFFHNIFRVIIDPKAIIRTEAVSSLRAALMVTSQRETKQTQKTLWYKQCLAEATKMCDMAESFGSSQKDDYYHSGLLIFNELLRIANAEAEKVRQEAIDLIKENVLEEEKLGSHWKSRLKGTRSYGETKDVITMLLSSYQYPFVESRTCRRLMNDNFDKTCDYVKKARNSRGVHVRVILLELLPRLATLDPVEFKERHFDDSIQYILSCVSREKEKGQAFLALGLFAVVEKERIRVHIKSIFDMIRLHFPGKDLPKKKQVPMEPNLFICITLLVSSLGKDPEVEAHIKTILPSMFATGLSPGLTVALQEIAKQIPSVRAMVQDGLLQQLSLIIMQKPMPSRLQPPIKTELPQGPITVSDSDVALTVLALKTLGNFHFPRYSLETFLKYIAHGYLNSNNTVIRLAGIRSCSRLLIPFVLLLDRKDRSAQWYMPLLSMIHEILGKLLAVAVTDAEVQVRFSVYDCLSEAGPALSSHLAQAEMLSLITMGLQDENFVIRELVVSILGSLGEVNPALVMPDLRRVLVHILNELNHSGLSRMEEQSARLLGRLVSSSPKLMKPYMQSILQTLIPKFTAKSMHLDVIVSMLYAVGELAQVGGEELKESIGQIMPILIEYLQDSSSLPKREAALWSMGRLIQHTGFVIEPYRKYPDLLEILLRFLKTEQSPSMRRETIRVLGIIGALDPYQQKVFAGSVESASNSTSLALSMPDPRDSKDNRQDIVQWFNWERYTLEEFYPALAIANLMHIVSDPALSDHHTMVIGAVMQIFQRLGVARCLPFLDQVVPRLIPIIRNSKADDQNRTFRQLGGLVGIVKHHIKPYLREIMNLIKEFWTPTTPMRKTIISVVEQIATALEYEFKPFVPELMPSMLKVFVQDDSEGREVTVTLLKSLRESCSVLEEHLHLLIPQAKKLLDSAEAPSNLEVRREAIRMLQEFTDKLSVAEFASGLMLCLVRVMDKFPELRVPAYNLIVSLGYQMGTNFLVFLPQIQRIISEHRFIDREHKLDSLAKQLEEDGRIVMTRPLVPKQKPLRPAESHKSKLALTDLAELKRKWKVSSVASKEDWALWLHNFRKELLKQSPYAALKACADLAHHYDALSKDLFHAAFMSVWTELMPDEQDELTECLKEALEHSEHPEITQTILNLAEFMDHSEKGPLPIFITILGEHSMKSRAFAKALRYKELEMLTPSGVTAENCEALITLNNKLQLQEEAVGVVDFASTNNVSIHLQGRWYEKLHHWEKALDLYDIQSKDSSVNKFDNDYSRMRCLDALGDWNRLHGISRKIWGDVDPNSRTKMATLAAAGAWGMQDWDAMETYVSAINKSSQDGCFLRAVLSVHKGHYAVAQQYIDKVRDLIDTELTAMAGESYERAYGAMISVQKLSELEEAIQFKLLPERQREICQIWWTRLKGCRDNVEDWQKLLQVRSLVLSPDEMRRTWMKFASLCRRSEKVSMSRKVLVSLLGEDPLKSPAFPVTAHPDLVFAYTKQLWIEGRHEDAYGQLKTLVETSLKQKQKILQDLARQARTNSISIPPAWEDVDVMSLSAKCYLKLAQWRESQSLCKIDESDEESLSEVMSFYKAATDCDRNWYKAWHALASCNFNAVLHYKELLRQSEKASPPIDVVAVQAQQRTELLFNQYALRSVQCFFRAINLCRGSRLQDTLRLLTLWFDYGQSPEVLEALKEGLQTVPVDTWLQVIPQLIARIETPKPFMAKLITDLLADVGSIHPQALVYPLTVAGKSSNKGRQTAATKLLQRMSEHSPNLVLQAKSVSEEFIRVAILWHELWHEGLEEASRQYFADHNVQGMFRTLEPLHNMIESGPTTSKEQSFHQTYYKDLKEARAHCTAYKRSQDARVLTQAWDLYYVVFKKISKQLPQLTQLELQYVSPKLLMCRDLELAVPGTYDPTRPIVKIHSFQASLQVITSKQRPRKVCVKGSDGQDYMFLLKGHEDPRQDERVMQLFGLVNTLLLQEPETCRRNLTIQRYSIIPLSQNSGLIGWVPNCDTLHALLRDYREKKKILLNLEHQLIKRMAPEYDHLTLLQKVEVFEHALDHTTESGKDLQKILWLKSPNSEVWFDRRTNYTRSLATMSMVGYILGLGDRHPSNLMLDRMSGKIVHIDFGDCFEVAMNREKFPEKIPFRLTRMLISAMEVTGIEGNFKTTCERVMKVLRENRESVLAVLEAFVYDPLINWRLVDQGLGPKQRQHGETSGAYANEGSGISDEFGKGQYTKQQESEQGQNEAVSNKAILVIQRIRNKLTGQDIFSTDSSRENATRETADIKTQVSYLIEQAISHENLCQCYIGWCPFW